MRDLKPDEYLYDKIKSKPIHQIKYDDINPFTDLELKGTFYVMGSPGSGKSRFLIRIAKETDGVLVPESGVFDLFQSYLINWLEQAKASGREVFMFEYDFDMPNIDGLYVSENMQSIGGEDTVVHNALYKGIGAYCYREFLPQISSGGKSGFPDWIFIPDGSGSYYQGLSIPGHFSLEEVLANKSLPELPIPDSVIYLVDPEILDYNKSVGRAVKPRWPEKPTFEWYGGNPALRACNKQLENVLRFEEKGVGVHWFLSKTFKPVLEAKRAKALEIYTGDKDTEFGSDAYFQYLNKPLDDLAEIANRLPDLEGFDSFASSRLEMYKIMRQIGIMIPPSQLSRKEVKRKLPG